MMLPEIAAYLTDEDQNIESLHNHPIVKKLL